MSYYTQSKLAFDAALADRVTACAALERCADIEGWFTSHRWQLSAQPGWDAAYAYALASGVERPGASDSVISDWMILAAVQSIQAADSPPPPPETSTSPAE